MSEIDWEAEAAEEVRVVTDAELSRIAGLAERQLELERSIEEVEASLKVLKDDHRQVSEVDLPMALDEAHVESFTLTNGRRIRVEEKLLMSVPKIRKGECADWLQQNGLGSLVSEDVIVRFERGEEAKIFQLQSVLEGAGFSDWTVTERMNTSSIKGAFRERMERGEVVPLEMFGGYLRRASVVK